MKKLKAYEMINGKYKVPEGVELEACNQLGLEHGGVPNDSLRDWSQQFLRDFAVGMQIEVWKAREKNRSIS